MEFLAQLALPSTFAFPQNETKSRIGQKTPLPPIGVHCGSPCRNFNAIFMRSFWLPIFLFPPYS